MHLFYWNWVAPKGPNVEQKKNWKKINRVDGTSLLMQVVKVQIMCIKHMETGVTINWEL